MPLDPQVQTLMDQMAALNAPPIHTLTPELVRMGIKMQFANATDEPESVAQVVNRTFPSAGLLSRWRLGDMRSGHA